MFKYHHINKKLACISRKYLIIVEQGKPYRYCRLDNNPPQLEAISHSPEISAKQFVEQLNKAVKFKDVLVKVLYQLEVEESLMIPENLKQIA